MGKKTTKSTKNAKITKVPERTQLLEYAGVSLYRTEYSVLMDLEVQIGQNIPSILDTARTPFGFVAENGYLLQLGLANQKLIKLPKSIGLLLKIEVLDLANNQLETLPDAICDLKSLKILILEENRLQSLPIKIGQLQILEKLYLFQNQLSEVPPSFIYLSNLQEVSFHSNHIKMLPEDFGQLTSLKKLGLGSNHLSTIPPSIGKLSQLEYLSIEENYLRQVPDELGLLKNLLELNLFNNPLETLPSSLRNLTKLKKFKVFETNISIEKMQQEMELILDTFRKQGCDVIAHGRDPRATQPDITHAIQGLKAKFLTEKEKNLAESKTEIKISSEIPANPDYEKHILEELQKHLSILAVGDEPDRALVLLQLEEKIRGNPIPNTVFDILLSTYEKDESPRIRSLAIRILFHPPSPSWFFTRDQRDKIRHALQNNKQGGVEGDISQEYLEIDDTLHFFSKKEAN